MNTEVIVEYAQFFDCYEELNASYSKHTMSDVCDRWYDGHIGTPLVMEKGLHTWLCSAGGSRLA